jgi:drug/metabolite transporter (DMT)-like permease
MVFFGLLFRLGSYRTPNVTITEKKFVSRLVALIATIILAPIFLANERFEAIRLLGMLIAIPGYYIIAWHRIIKEKSL